MQVAGSGQAEHAVIVWGTALSSQRLDGRTAGFMPSGRGPPSLLSLPAAGFPLDSEFLESSTLTFFAAAGFLALFFLTSAGGPLSAVPFEVPGLALLVAGTALWLLPVAASGAAATDARVFLLLAVEAAVDPLSPAALLVACTALRFCMHSQNSMPHAD